MGAHYLPMENIKLMRKAATFKDFLKYCEKLKAKLNRTGLKKEVMLMFLCDKLAQGKGCTDKEQLFAVKDSLLTGKPSAQELYKKFF